MLLCDGAYTRGPKGREGAHSLSHPDVHPSNSRAPALALQMGDGSAGGMAETQVQVSALTQVAHSATGSLFNLCHPWFLPERDDKIVLQSFKHTIAT